MPTGTIARLLIDKGLSDSFAMKAASNTSSTAALSEAPFSSCCAKDSGSSSPQKNQRKAREPETFV
jgi:hypothetical protein